MWKLQIKNSSSSAHACLAAPQPDKSPKYKYITRTPDDNKEYSQIVPNCAYCKDGQCVKYELFFNSTKFEFKHIIKPHTSLLLTDTCICAIKTSTISVLELCEKLDLLNETNDIDIKQFIKKIEKEKKPTKITNKKNKLNHDKKRNYKMMTNYLNDDDEQTESDDNDSAPTRKKRKYNNNRNNSILQPFIVQFDHHIKNPCDDIPNLENGGDCGNKHNSEVCKITNIITNMYIIIQFCQI